MIAALAAKGVTWSASDTYLIVTVAVLLVLSGFFAVAETSLVRMNKSRARSLRDQGRHGAKALVELSESPEKFLNTILLLVLICQLVSATMVGVLAGRLFGAAGLFIATVGEVLIIFVVFEAIPKNYAVQHPDSAALTAAPVVRTDPEVLADQVGLSIPARRSPTRSSAGSVRPGAPRA